MKKINETFVDYLQRARELSGIKPIHEATGTASTILSSTKGSDNVNYSIVKEEGSYFIKTSLNEGALDYIGGIRNKHNNKYKYDSYAHASRNLNMMLIELNESFGSLDERLTKDIGQEESNGPAMPLPGEGGEMPQAAPETAPAPAPAQPEAPMPAPEEVPQAAPAPAQPEAPAPAGDDSDLDGNSGDEESQIDHYVGKLTYEIRNAGEDKMNPDKVKSIMNSIISALPLNTLDPETLLELARRVKHPSNGSENPEQDGQVPEAPQPEEAPQAEAPQPEEAPVDEYTIPMSELMSGLEKQSSQFKDPHSMNRF